MMRDNLLTPIAGVLITSEALIKGKYGALNDAQHESLDIIHNCAVDTYRRTMHIMEDFDSGLAFESPHIGHDWLTPGANIISYSDFLMMGYDGELTPMQRQKTAWMFHQTHFLRRQVFNVLNYRHLMRGEKKPFKEFNIGEIFDKGLVIVDNATPVTWDIPETLPRVYNHHRYISQTLSNLLANAQAADATEIHVRVQVYSNFVEISVEDNGRGIGLEHQVEIFEPFYKIKRSTPGIGIGLYIARQFVAWQRGIFTFKSKPGVGTTASFTIPTTIETAS